MESKHNSHYGIFCGLLMNWEPGKLFDVQFNIKSPPKKLNSFDVLLTLLPEDKKSSKIKWKYYVLCVHLWVHEQPTRKTFLIFQTSIQ